MVCIAPRLPSVRFGQHESHRYDTAWIEQSIAHAAAQAGHTQWVFANDIARGVIEYLSEKFAAPQISLTDLGDKISCTLETVGFPDIAALLEMPPPPVEVSLATIARDGSPGFELYFFQQLDNEVGQLRRDGVDKIRFTGLRRAVDHLLPAPRKNRPARKLHAARQEHLRAEIVDFIRARTGGTPSTAVVIR